MNCHTVPRSYLRKFADENDRVFVFNKESMDEPFKTHVANVATERDLYVLTPRVSEKNAVDPKVVENAYSEGPDGVLMRCVHDLLEMASVKPFDRRTKIRAGQFILFQFFRTRSAVNLMKDFFVSTQRDYRQQAENLGYIEDDQDLFPTPTASDRGASLALSSLLFDEKKTLPQVTRLCARQWRLWENRTETSLLTSDAPVVLQPMKRKLSESVLHSDATRIFLPITPRFLLEISEQPYSGVSLDTLERQVLTRSRLGTVNSLQIAQSDRLLISDQNDFHKVAEACRLDPSIRRPGTLKIGFDLPRLSMPRTVVEEIIQEKIRRNVGERPSEQKPNEGS